MCHLTCSGSVDYCGLFLPFTRWELALFLKKTITRTKCLQIHQALCSPCPCKEYTEWITHIQENCNYERNKSCTETQSMWKTSTVPGLSSGPPAVKISASPGDGHCLMHSIVTACNSQLYHLPPISLHGIKATVFTERVKKLGKVCSFH